MHKFSAIGGRPAVLKAAPLFLLFLQEIISERHLLTRRNPGVPEASEQNNSEPPECSVAAD